MRKSIKITILICTAFLFSALLCFAGLAYYEFYGQYSDILNINGTIKNDAFGCLYTNLKDETWGVTPENPYVIDTEGRYQTLIRLQNNGKLESTKSLGQKYYFTLEFDGQAVPQILDLKNAEYSSIGNNQYPFMDELSGIVYAYQIKSGEYVYYSGCVPTVEITVKNSTVYIDGEESSLSSSTYTEGKYLKLSRYYDSTSYDSEDVDGSMTFVENAAGVYTYIKIDGENCKAIHQIIQNEKIIADEEQIDVGFISAIGETGNVHDLILYNISISCEETVTRTVHDYIHDLFANINQTDSEGKKILHDHHFAAEDMTDERHIGIFAGHIDGAAANISIGGTTNLTINTAAVNYYSKYTTVGYIYENATIGGVKFSMVSSDAVAGGDLGGCLFADDIYKLSNSGNVKGTNNYTLSSIEASGTWPGVEDNRFKYGSFTFLLSTSNDYASSIWNGTGGEINLLGKSGYKVNGNVLYCADEYRYDPDAPSIHPSAASVAEGVYTSISDIESAGNVIDVGNYMIVAHIGDQYYAVKMIASEDAAGNVSYSFDYSDNNVTSFINDTTGNVKVYQSCLWVVEAPTSTPVFKNLRYSKYLTHTEESIGFGETGNTFSVKIKDNEFYFEVIDAETEEIIQYYLNYEAGVGFYMSTTKETDIEVWQVADGFNLEIVDAVTDVKTNTDYVIVAKDASGNSYLVGAKSTDNVISNQFALDKSYTSGNFPTSISLSEYNMMKNYIWRAEVATSGSGNVTFKDKASNTYYLGLANNTLSLNTTSTTWKYTQGASGGTLKSGNYYISYSYNSTQTGFSASTTSYTLYLYEIITQDTTPTYSTYDGARMLDAQASTISAGTYVIVATYDESTYTIGATSSASTSQEIDVNNANSLGNDYKWTVTADTDGTDAPVFKNVNRTSRYLTATTTAVSTGTSSFTWRYDAINQRVYYINNQVTYYLVYGSTGFKIVNTLSDDTVSYLVSLYKVDTQYTYTNVQKITSISGFQESNKLFFFSTDDITNTANNSYLIGYNGSSFTDSKADVAYLSIQNKYTYASNSITSSISLDYYAWSFAGNYNSSSRDRSKLANVYNYGYGKDSSNNYVLMAVTSEGGNRQLKLVKAQNCYQYYMTNNKEGFKVNTTTSSTTSEQPTGFVAVQVGGEFGIGFAGGYKGYYLVKQTQKSATVIMVNTFRTTENINYSVESLSGYTTMQYYSCDKGDELTVLNLVSSSGDPLEENIHYVLAAQVTDNGQSKYMAVSYDSTKGTNLYGNDLTSTLSPIISRGNDGYSNITNVPADSDWTQISSDYALRFKHSLSSTEDTINYMSTSGSSLSIQPKPISSAYTTVNPFYYDQINKVLSTTISTIKYYVTYNSSTGLFGLSTSSLQAAHIILIRYTPTYKVSQVTDYTQLENGEYIIAGHSVDGYYALGSSGSTLTADNVTKIISSDLSEEQYAQLTNDLWTQVYSYGDDNISTDGDGAVYFQLENKATGGGFAPVLVSSSAKLQSYSAPYLWRVKETNDLWAFQNAVSTGANIAANNYGLSYSTSSTSSALKITDTFKGIDFYIGAYSNGYFTSQSSMENGCQVTIYEYSNGTYTQVTGNLASSKQYVIFVKDNNYHYVICYNTSSGVITRSSIGKNLNSYQSALENLPSNLGYLFASSSTTNNGATYISLSYTYSGSTRYLAFSSNNLTYSTSVSYWDYSYAERIPSNSRLYSCSSHSKSAQYLQAAGSLVKTSSSTETYLYTVTVSGSTYTLGNIATSVSSSSAYAIIIFQNGVYYVVTRASESSTEVTIMSIGNAIPVSLDATQLWKVSGTSSADITPYSDASLYLRLGTEEQLILSSSKTGCSWSYSGSSSGSTSFGVSSSTSFGGTKFYIFKVTLNDKLDSVSDVNTPLVGKAKTTASLTVLESMHYIIVAEDTNAYYALSISDESSIKAIDITDTFTVAESGGTIRLYSASVWTQRGSDYSLIFDSEGFTNENHYLLDGQVSHQVNNSPVLSELTEDEYQTANKSLYTWTVHTFTDMSGKHYLMGYYVPESDQTFYLYFDSSTKSYKLTTNYETAKSGLVSIYQLGEEVEHAVTSQTFQILLEADNVTVAQYPLNETTPNEIDYFSNSSSTTAESGMTINKIIAGEYLIAAKVGNNTYALYNDTTGALHYADISLLLDGNFIKDDSGFYCVSINTLYLWKQMTSKSNLTFTGTTLVEGMVLQNYSSRTNLYYNQTTNNQIAFDGTHIYITVSGTRYYLTFSEGNGFSFSTTTPSLNITVYRVGTNGVASGGNNLNYTEYSTTLNDIDYSFFTYNIYDIDNLPNYDKDKDGNLIYTNGWSLTNDTTLSEINDSILFTNGINYSSEVATFTNEFDLVEYEYLYTDPNTTLTSQKKASYYAPKGTISFTVGEASEEFPVYMNVICSTELAASYSSSPAARYLSVWKVGSFDFTSGVTSVTEYSGSTSSSAAYANAFSQMYYTPYAAIPLVNKYDTSTGVSSTSYLKVNDGAETNVYYLNNYTDALVAHTFQITEPGVYYVGSTYGTVAYCYIQIDKMLASDEGEDNSTNISEAFSIDYVYGSLETTEATYDMDSALDYGVGTVAYVGKKVFDGEGHVVIGDSWVHSNVYPEFINGTNGTGSGTNPTDYLSMTIARTYSTGVATLSISVRTDAGIYDDGKGILLQNQNNTSQRATRPVNYSISIEKMETTSTSMVIIGNVTSIPSSLSPVTTVYYSGNADDWSVLASGTSFSGTVYYYSKQEPESAGNYWHYDSNNNPVVWVIEP